MSDLKICGLQLDLAWEDPQTNLRKIESYFPSLYGKCDWLILPEMFTSGFTMQPQNVVSENKKVLQWMQQMASEWQFTLCGSLAWEYDSKYYNRLFVVQPQGDMQFYDKHKLFSFANEQEHYSPGQKQLLVYYQDWVVKPLVCYDLRFPVWSRNTAGYDVLIYVANWPERRVDHWNTLLKARAIENQAYVVGINRVGADAKKIMHNGCSAIYGPKGDLLDFKINEEGCVTALLNKNELLHYRQKFPALADRDTFFFDQKEIE